MSIPRIVDVELESDVDSDIVCISVVVKSPPSGSGSIAGSTQRRRARDEAQDAFNIDAEHFDINSLSNDEDDKQKVVDDEAFARGLQLKFDETARLEGIEARNKRLRAETCKPSISGKSHRPPIESYARKIQAEYEERARQLELQEQMDAEVASKFEIEEKARLEEETRRAYEIRMKQEEEVALGIYQHTGGYTEPPIVSLLVMLFKAAALAAASEKDMTKASRMITPYPSIPDSKPAMEPGKPDFANLYSLAWSLPQATLLEATADFNSLKQYPHQVPLTAFLLLKWVVNTNCSYLERVPRQFHIPSLATQYQYIMMIGTPEKEAAFQKLKAQHGVKWAFHGSKSGNWHSILRNGLMNMSGTPHQANGAAHGTGVYLAPDATTSLKYSCGRRRTPTDNHKIDDPIDPAKMVCLTLCEVVANSYKDHGWCWTVLDPNAVMTRLFFVFPNGTFDFNENQCSTVDPRFVATVEDILKKLFNGPPS